MKTGGFILMLLMTINLWAQEASTRKISSPNESYITVNLVSFIKNTPTWRLGYIHSINERWKVGTELGYGTDDTKSGFEHAIRDYKAYEVRPELYYFLKSRENWRSYVSVQNALSHQTSTLLDNHYRFNDYAVQYESAHFRRNKIGLTVNYGFMFKVIDKISLNFYFGLGPTMVHHRFSDLKNPQKDFNYDGDAWFVPYYRYAGYSTYFYVLGGAKMVFKLDK